MACCWLPGLLGDTSEVVAMFPPALDDAIVDGILLGLLGNPVACWTAGDGVPTDLAALGMAGGGLLISGFAFGMGCPAAGVFV